MDLSSCRTCLTQQRSSVQLTLFNAAHDEMTEHIKLITDIQILDSQYAMCNDCINMMIDCMNFRRKAIESNNIILSSSVAVMIVKPEIDYVDDYPAIVTTFDFSPATSSSIDNVKRIAKIESSEDDAEEKNSLWSQLHLNEQPWSSCIEVKHVKKKVKREPSKPRKVRGPYGKRKKPKIKNADDEINEYPCEICGKVFKKASLVSGHKKFVHTIMTLDDYYFCDLCPRKFKTKGACSWHIQQRHILKTSFSCVECEVTFKTKWQLKCHNKSKHLKIFDSQCVICGKAFANKQKLEVHMRIHTGERNYKCNICTKTYIHKTDLRRHIWSHGNFRPYVCQFLGCTKGFMKNSELKNHQAKFGHFYEPDNTLQQGVKI